MKWFALAVAALSGPVLPAPVAITCNGPALDPTSGRPLTSRTLTMGFEFDQDAQSMTLTEGGKDGPEQLHGVSVTNGMARGTNGKWIFEINRVDGTAISRLDLSNDQRRRELGLGGTFFKGNCAQTGRGKF